MKKTAVKTHTRDARKIMLVENNRNSRKKAEALLCALGYQVFTANDGFDALSKTIDYQPELIFIHTELDGELDGFQTCTLIKSNNAFANTPIILFSNKGIDFNPAKVQAAGAVQQIDKPLDENKLLTQLRAQLP